MSQKLDLIAACPTHLSDGRTLSLGPLDGPQSEILGEAFSGIDPWARYPYPASQLKAYFAGSTQDSPRYSILIDGCLGGAIGLKLDWLRGPYVQFLGLLPQYQKGGAGRTVLAALEQAALQSGSRNLWVCASDFNGSAIAFYEGLGFRSVAALPGLVREGRTELLFRKALHSA